jgi:hypothetical protein
MTAHAIQTPAGPRRAKSQWRILLEQYAYEAGLFEGEMFQPAEVAQLTADEVYYSKPVGAEILGWLDRAARIVAEPKGRAYVLSARAYLTELRRRQGEVFTLYAAYAARQSEIIGALLSGSDLADEDRAALVGEIVADVPERWEDLTVDQLDAEAVRQGFKKAKP